MKIKYLSISAVIEMSASALGIAVEDGAAMRDQLETIIASVFSLNNYILKHRKTTRVFK